MAKFDLFSVGQQRLAGHLPDELTYDKIPQALSVQIGHIIQDAIGEGFRRI